jgi:hypothetical protein
MSAKLPGWRQQKQPNEEMCNRLRQYIVEAVFARYNEKHKPSNLLNIYLNVDARIEREWPVIWPKRWGKPSKRTVDRRVSEAADPRYYPDNLPKIVAVTAGVYTVNPVLFKEATP